MLALSIAAAAVSVPTLVGMTVLRVRRLIVPTGKHATW